MDLDTLRAEYLAADPGGQSITLSGDESRGSASIYLSELGSCPRRAMLRMMGAKERDLTPGERMMFWLGNQVHDLTYRALIHAGRMVAYEQRLECPDGISGRFDCLWDDDGVLTLTDIKTVRPNQFKYGELSFDPPQPRPDHVLQMGGYILYGPRADVYDIEYIDRGGAHASIRVRVEPESAKAAAQKAIDRLLAARAALPELPPLLEPQLKFHYSRGGDLKWIGLRRDWRCDSLYCRFSGVSCEPKGPDAEIRVWEDGKLTSHGWAHAERVEAAVAAQGVV